MWQVAQSRSGHFWLFAIAAVAAISCAAPSRQQGIVPTADGETTGRQPKGILIWAYGIEPQSLHPKFSQGSAVGSFDWLFSSTLTLRDFQGSFFPVLAEEIPTQSNGSWVINPDGTMVTTYRLRRARWHDGTRLTAQDFVFAHEVYRDPEMPIQNAHFERMMERVDAGDDQTLVITWNQLYINAATLARQQLNPLPRHIHEEKYRNNRANFIIGEEWTRSYVGTGPFRLESWEPGTQMVARANPEFVLGSPRIETIILRLLLDPSVQVANLLSGDVDLVSRPTIRATEAALIRDRWEQSGDGYIRVWTTNTSYLEFQFREVPGWTRALLDVRVRRALVHAVDRDGLAEAVNLGFAPSAETFLTPSDPIFDTVGRVIVKYPYDPNRAESLLAEAGWRRPAGSDPLVDGAGNTLDAELHSSLSNLPTAQIVTDNWKSVGANSSIFQISPALERNGELRAQFKATGLNGRGIGADYFVWTCDRFATRENGWTGANRGNFCDPEIDRLQGIRLQSLGQNERREATIVQMRRMSEAVGVMPLIYSVEVLAARKHLIGPVGAHSEQDGITWNVHEWTIQ